MKTQTSSKIVIAIALMFIVDTALFTFLLEVDISAFFAMSMAIFDFFLLVWLVKLLSESREPNIIGILFYVVSTSLMIFMFARFYMKTGINVGEGHISYGFYDSIYFSIVTWTSLGYGDVKPTEASRPWVMTEVFFGYIHMGILVGLFLDFLKLGRR